MKDKNIYVCGIGPGAEEQMTIEVRKTLEECDTIVGYTVYLDLLPEELKSKEFLTTPMRKEEDRCRMAFEEAMKKAEELLLLLRKQLAKCFIRQIQPR